jgi:hypothetical protein
VERQAADNRRRRTNHHACPRCTRFALIEPDKPGHEVKCGRLSAQIASSRLTPSRKLISDSTDPLMSINAVAPSAGSILRHGLAQSQQCAYHCHRCGDYLFDRGGGVRALNNGGYGVDHHLRASRSMSRLVPSRSWHSRVSAASYVGARAQPAIFSTRFTMLRRSLAFLICMNAFVSTSPSDVARKSDT